jgi:hypothetical protein
MEASCLECTGVAFALLAPGLLVLRLSWLPRPAQFLSASPGWVLISCTLPTLPLLYSRCCYGLNVSSQFHMLESWSLMWQC